MAQLLPEQSPVPQRPPLHSRHVLKPLTASRKRTVSLSRLFENISARFWLIDEEDKLVYLSPAMQAWLGDVALAKGVCPNILLPTHNLKSRGHQTKMITSPGSGQSASAHLVQITDPTVSGLPLATSSPCLTMGFLGGYVADDEIPVDDWFGPQGIRERAKLQREIDALRVSQAEAACLIVSGESAPAKKLKAQTELAARVRYDLGIFGPSGCGGVELALDIHSRSTKNETLVQLDAPLMDRDLLEAYASPATQRLINDPEAEATILLEGIQAMPEDGQALLLVWLETWQHRLRVIGIIDTDDVATKDNDTEDNYTEDNRGLFRMDSGLLDRLSTLRVDVPSISDRCEDHELLLTGLVIRACRSTMNSVDYPSLSREFIEAAAEYPWPNQWNELAAAVSFACEAVRGDHLKREHLPLAVRSYRLGNSQKLSAVEEPLVSLDQAIANYERTLIEEAVAISRGNKAEAARRLGISRTRLLRKLAAMDAPDTDATP